MSIVITAVGDTMIGRTFNQILDNNLLKNVWGNTKKIFDTSHLVFANLETTLSDGNPKNKMPDKVFNYFLKPQYAGILRDIEIDYVSLANNHILDYQNPGAKETQKTLDSLNIHYSGFGKNLHNARRPAIFKIKLIPDISVKYNRIAVFSAADHYKEWQSTPNQPGIWYIHHTEPE